MRSKYRAVRTELKESDIQKACTDLLDAYRIPWTRRNVGTMAGSHKGKRWFVRYGRKGEADIEAWPEVKTSSLLPVGMRVPFAGAEAIGALNYLAKVPIRTTLWLEVKRPDGKQSQDQEEFQFWAESIGHTYLLVRDVSELEKWLKREV